MHSKYIYLRIVACINKLLPLLDKDPLRRETKVSFLVSGQIGASNSWQFCVPVLQDLLHLLELQEYHFAIEVAWCACSHSTNRLEWPPGPS